VTVIYRWLVIKLSSALLFANIWERIQFVVSSDLWIAFLEDLIQDSIRPSNSSTMWSTLDKYLTWLLSLTDCTDKKSIEKIIKYIFCARIFLPFDFSRLNHRRQSRLMRTGCLCVASFHCDGVFYDDFLRMLNTLFLSSLHVSRRRQTTLYFFVLSFS